MSPHVRRHGSHSQDVGRVTSPITVSSTSCTTSHEVLGSSNAWHTGERRRRRCRTLLPRTSFAAARSSIVRSDFRIRRARDATYAATTASTLPRFSSSGAPAVCSGDGVPAIPVPHVFRLRRLLDVLPDDGRSAGRASAVRTVSNTSLLFDGESHRRKGYRQGW